LQSTMRYAMALDARSDLRNMPKNVKAVLQGPMTAARDRRGRRTEELKLLSVVAQLREPDGERVTASLDLDAFAKATKDRDIDTPMGRNQAFYQWLGRNAFAPARGEELEEITFVFQDPLSGRPIPLKLQHSKSAGRARPPGRSDYTTLQGFDLDSLPKVLARKVASPRKRRRGRTLDPIAKTNPTATRNPMARPSYLQPLDEFYLEQDFGPSGQFAYLYGEYGARPGLPVNRRNPRKGRKAKKAASKSRKATARKVSTKGRKVTAWNKEFGRLAKKAQAIMASRGCSLKAAFAEARGGKRAAANRGSARKNGGYRHSAKARNNKRLTPAQLRAGFGGKAAMRRALNNHGGNYLPEFEAHSTEIAQYWKPSRTASPSVLWPRETEYDYVQGVYGPSMALPPVNRRNPKAKKNRTRKSSKGRR
jgi:hypothetical protein